LKVGGSIPAVPTRKKLHRVGSPVGFFSLPFGYLKKARITPYQFESPPNFLNRNLDRLSHLCIIPKI
jgi:hypothetical protein